MCERERFHTVDLVRVKICQFVVTIGYDARSKMRNKIAMDFRWLCPIRVKCCLKMLNYHLLTVNFIICMVFFFSSFLSSSKRFWCVSTSLHMYAKRNFNAIKEGNKEIEMYDVDCRIILKVTMPHFEVMPHSIWFLFRTKERERDYGNVYYIPKTG